MNVDELLARQAHREELNSGQTDMFGATPESYDEYAEGADEALASLADDLAESDEEYYRIVEEFKVAQGMTSVVWDREQYVSYIQRTEIPRNSRPYKSWWALPPKS